MDDEDDYTAELTAVRQQAAATPSLATAASGALAAGTLVRDRYRIEAVLDQGGSAIVYQARDLRCDAPSNPSALVALKMLRPELRQREPSIARLKREFYQTRMLAHPNVVRAFELDCHEGTWFTVMEFLNGVPLSARLGTAPPLAGTRIVEILRAIGAALQFAHVRGVMHGDLKPANIFLLHDGQIKLLDFGTSPDPWTALADPTIARIPPATTRAYASPQVLAGAAPTPRDDVYSLACIVRQLIDAQPTASATQHPLRFTEQQRTLLDSGMNPDAAKRPASVAGLLRFLEPPAATVSPAFVTPERPRRGPALAVAVVAVAVAAAAVILWLSGRVNSSKSSLPAPQRVLSPSVGGDAVHESEAPAATTAADLQPSAAPVPLASDTAGATAATTAVADGTPPETAVPEAQFATAAMTVSERASVAALPVERLAQHAGPIQLTWSITEGTARLGRDFTGPSSGELRFAEFQNSRTLYIPLIRGGGGSRTFTVTLQGAFQGGQTGFNRRIAVTIE